MKALKIINTGILIITLLLYITIYYGLYSQIILGIVQVITSLILGINYNKLDLLIQTKLKRYWVFVMLYFSCWLLPWNRIINDTNGIILTAIGIVIIPMALAIYFQIILTSIKHLNHETK